MVLTRNPWEALCDLAARENWCWNIACTTCGATPFRRAIRALGEGKHPDSADWPKQDQLLQQGPLRNRARNARLIVDELAWADLSYIAKHCPFPDWLGYIGLVLQETESYERVTRRLTDEWGSQLLEMLPTDAESHAYLQAILDDETPKQVIGFETYLRWRDLEALEGDLYRETRVRASEATVMQDRG